MNMETDKNTTAIETYLKAVDAIFRSRVATEHSYRGALQTLLSSLLPGVSVVNEPKRVECGAPDLILTRRGLPVAFVEAKDIGDDDLDGTKKSGNREQFDRYKQSLDTLAFTDYLDFRLYLHGEPVASARIGEVRDGRIVPLPANFDTFLPLAEQLGRATPRKISTAPQLAALMAAKARLLCVAARRLLARDGFTGNPSVDSLLSPGTSVGRLMAVFRRVLVPNVTPDDFADIYAQTLVYGMFAARLHDNTPADFSRYEAAALVPKSNPFLKKLFAHLATDGDSDADWIVDDIVALFAAADVRRILRDYGQSTGQRDPMIHFYEDFLDAYDPAARKNRGVWYTPLPVVQFIVRAVDTLLARRFGFPDGLAARARTTIAVSEGSGPAPRRVNKSIPRIQVLDPATGTGTFLAECVNRIRAKFDGNEGLWPGYVRDDLIPRLNGFELLMASYTMAHVKLDLVLAATGYTHTADSRFNVFLTDSLKEGFPAPSSLLFAEELCAEANAANFVKKNLPVMVVLGNPPYNISSQNKGEWIQRLLEDYKKGLGEKKLNLDDDYIKFIRLGQHYIQKNGSGILAYITNNSFLDGITHRRMRQSLLETFDEIYILNLHGNYRKKETTPDNSKDENVFAIMQGVSINIFLKNGGREKNRIVRYADLWGKRAKKFQILETSEIEAIPWQDLIPAAPNFFFVPKDFKLADEYQTGFSIIEAFPSYNSGIQTKNDDLVVSFETKRVNDIIHDFSNLPQEEVRSKYGLPQQDGVWKLPVAMADLKDHIADVVFYSYRPFDVRHTAYTGASQAFMGRSRDSIMRHFRKHDNIGFVLCRTISSPVFRHIFVTEAIADIHLISDQSYICPLYLYEETLGGLEKRPNLDTGILARFAQILGREPAPEEVFDWVYGVLHTPEYRERFLEFLKVDFPRVPYPRDEEEFLEVVRLGCALRDCHLMRDAPPTLGERTASFPVPGDCRVDKVTFEAGKVWINASQHFANVDAADWEAWIGGYQPAQKWLKDRRGRILSSDDLRHYRRIILALRKTRALMADLSAHWRARRE